MAQESNKEEKDAVAEGGDGGGDGSGDEKKEAVAEAEDRKEEDGNEGEASEEGNPVCTTPTFTLMICSTGLG